MTNTESNRVWTTEAVNDDCSQICRSDGCRSFARICCCFATTSIAIFFIVIMSMSIERIDSEHYGIPYSPITGRITNKVQSAGLHVKPAFGSFVLWPKTYSSRTERVDCNSADGVRINLLVKFQYLPRETSLYGLTNNYIDEKKYKNVLKKHSRSAIRNGCASFTTQEFQTNRAQVQTDIYDRLIDRLGSQMETDVIDVQLSNINRPEAYEKEVDEKEAARNDIDQAENEREQAITQSQTVFLQAQTAANRTIDTAETNGENRVTEAEAEAEVVTSKYYALSESYYNAKIALKLNDEELLNYIKTRLISEINANIALESPKKN